jgi:hypothetical protein
MQKSAKTLKREALDSSIGGERMSYEEAITKLSEDQAFRATVYAINTLLQAKGVYSAQEFQAYFCQYAEAQANGFRRKATASAGTVPVAVHASS